jgi:hypothetical protein
LKNHVTGLQFGIQPAGETAGQHQIGWGNTPARGDARPISQKFANGFPGILTTDAGNKNGDADFSGDDFPKRRGFLFEGEADESGHWG